MGIIGKALLGSVVIGSIAAGAVSTEEPAPLKLGEHRKLAFAPATLAPVAAWRVVEDKSPIDDSRTVVASTKSINTVQGMFGRLVNLDLVVRCLENRTNLYIRFGGLFMVGSEYGTWGDVTHRIDERPAVTTTWGQSTDHKALMLGGADAISMAKQMFGAKQMVVRATPYNESPVVATFNVEGLEAKIKPLRAACSW